MASILVRPLEMMAAMDSPQASAEYVRQLAESLANTADQLGVSLTITREPLQPFAMGHARHVVEAWPARHQPAPDLRPDGESGGTKP